jgi:glycosyltransferase involved in cell wall biosynthesis
VHLALLGYGDCLAELRSLAPQLGLDDAVTFTGRADAGMIREYLSTAAIGLSPDPLNPLNDVSTMNKTMEYMAHELPVVAFDLKETRVSAGDAAVYVPSGDIDGFAAAITELLDDELRRHAMGRFGRRRIESELAWEHQAPRYIGVYRSLLPRSHPDELAGVGSRSVTGTDHAPAPMTTGGRV